MKAANNEILPEGRMPVAPLSLGKRNRLFLIIAAAALWAGSLLLWAQQGIDRSILVAHNALRADPFVASLFSAIAKYGMSFILLIYVLVLAFSWKREDLKGFRKIFLLILLSWAIAGTAGDLLKMAVQRARPFIKYPVEIIPVIRPKFYSFPSGHSTKSMAFVLPFLLYASGKFAGKKWLKPLLLFAGLAVCYSRIMLGVHFPSDVLAGMGMAAACLPVAAAAANVFYARRWINEETLRTLALVCGAILLFLVLYLPAVS